MLYARTAEEFVRNEVLPGWRKSSRSSGARRLLANELEGEELRRHTANIDALSLELPIRTIAAKTHVAEALVAAGVGAGILARVDALKIIAALGLVSPSKIQLAVDRRARSQAVFSFFGVTLRFTPTWWLNGQPIGRL